MADPLALPGPRFVFTADPLEEATEYGVAQVILSGVADRGSWMGKHGRGTEEHDIYIYNISSVLNQTRMPVCPK